MKGRVIRHNTTKKCVTLSDSGLRCNIYTLMMDAEYHEIEEKIAGLFLPKGKQKKILKQGITYLPDNRYQRAMNELFLRRDEWREGAEGKRLIVRGIINL